MCLLAIWLDCYYFDGIVSVTHQTVSHTSMIPVMYWFVFVHLQESLPLLGVFQQCLDEVGNCVMQLSLYTHTCMCSNMCALSSSQDVHFARMNNATFNHQITQRLVEVCCIYEHAILCSADVCICVLSL